MLGMTQQQLAECVGIKFQQIQKYETGANRVSASRLWEISETMNVPIHYFFNGLQSGSLDPDASDVAEVPYTSTTVPGDPLNDKEAMDLIRSYYAIPENQRRQIFELARVLSSAVA